MSEYLKKQLFFLKKDLSAQLIVSIILTFLTIATPYVEGRLIDTIVYGKNEKIFVQIIGIISFILVLTLFFSYFSAKIQYFKVPKISVILVKRLLNTIFSKENDKVCEYEGTYLHSRINDDTTVMINYLFLTIPSLIGSVITVIGILILLITIEKKIILLFIVFITIYIFIYIMTSRHLYNSALALKDSTATYFSNRNSIFSRYTIIKAKKSEKFEMKNLDYFSKNMFAAMKENFKWNYVLSTSKVSVSLIFQILFFLVGGYLVIKGEWQIGTFTITTQYFTTIMNHLDTFFNVAMEHQKFKVSVDRLEEIIAIPEEKNGEYRGNTIEKIELKDFNIYTYGESPTFLYKSAISHTFFSNNIYSFAGENGVGKTTLLLTLIGIRKKYTGEIYINDRKISTMDLNYYREKNISIMLQNEVPEFILVKEYLNKFVSQDDRFKNNNELVSSVFFNEQFDIRNYLNKSFISLSGGERQLISLYVSLFKPNATLIILDEPFSNLASSLVPKLMDIINEIAKDGKIVILVSHDPVVLSRANVLKLERKKE